MLQITIFILMIKTMMIEGCENVDHWYPKDQGQAAYFP